MSRRSKRRAHRAKPEGREADVVERQSTNGAGETSAQEQTGVCATDADQDPVRSSWLKSMLPPLLIVLAGLAAYANSFQGEFIHDDLLAIRDNQTIRHLWPLDRVLFPPNQLLMV